MATMYIAEYADVVMSQRSGEQIPVGKNPPIAEQSVTYSSAEASNAFSDDTVMVRIITTGIAHLKFGTAPVATTSSAIKIAGSTPEYFGVIGGQKVSAVTGS